MYYALRKIGAIVRNVIFLKIIISLILVLLMTLFAVFGESYIGDVTGHLILVIVVSIPIGQIIAFFVICGRKWL